MFHPQALIRMKDGGAGHFLKILFQVRFIEGYFMARLFTIVSFNNMPDQYIISVIHTAYSTELLVGQTDQVKGFQSGCDSFFFIAEKK